MSPILTRPARPPRVPVPGPVDDATRREFLGILAVSGLLLGAPACAASDRARGAGGASRTFVDDEGRSVQIPVRPQRIVALRGDSVAVQLLDLGAPVVGVCYGSAAEYDGLGFDLDGVTFLDGFLGDTVSVEDIAALRPDLVAALSTDRSNFDQDTLDALGRVAPYVFVDTITPGVDEVMARCAELAGESAVRDIAALRAELAAAESALDDLLAGRWSEVTVEHMTYFGAGTFNSYAASSQVATDLLVRRGARPGALTQRAAAEGGFLTDVSLERLGDVQADLVVLDQQVGSRLTDQPVFGQLPVARAGQVLVFERGENAARVYTRYIQVARRLADELGALELRTDLAP